MIQGKKFVCLLLALLVLSMSGCRTSGAPRRVVTTEPALSGLDAEDMALLGTPPAREVTYVDRHPILSKPRDYWETSGDNTLVKAAAATFIGVPAGIVGEIRQIVVGSPPAMR